MPGNGSVGQRVGYVFLWLGPLIATGLVGPRALRIPVVDDAVGAVLFVATVTAMWVVGARGRRASEIGERCLVAGALLMAPFVLVGALWIGLGPPWQATAPENVMRYVVLMVASLAVSTGFVVGRDALACAGERTWSALSLATSVLGGVAYLVWVTFLLGAWVAHDRVGHAPDALVALEDVIDIQLFVAGALTYLATASFAASMRRVGWLGRGATRAYVLANLVALVLLTVRGLSFPDPRALDSPWYTQPGFIVGIPAVPWIMPFWLGLVLLRRAGGASSNETRATGSRIQPQ